MARLFWLSPSRGRRHCDPHTLLAKGVEFTQEPVEQPYGIDVGLRDPFGNHIRIVQLKA